MNELTLRRIVSLWWPLAFSWLLMGAELPVVSAVVARLPDPNINLAAYGGIVFPLILIVKSPIIMLLGASTTLSKDWACLPIDVPLHDDRQCRSNSAACPDRLHAAILLRSQWHPWHAGIIPAGRIGLLIMTPWAWAIAYRRFHQGVLIRFGHSGAVGTGTLVRLLTDVTVLAVGYFWSGQPGIVVATSAVAASVVAEAAYVGWIVRPILAGPS